MWGFSLTDFLNRALRVDGSRSRRSKRDSASSKCRRRPGDSLSNGSDGSVNGNVNGVDHITSFTSSNGADYADHFTHVPHPEEPVDLDRPVRCPLPEPCIMHDGRMFRDRLANSRRRSDLLGSMRETDHIEYYSTPSNRRRQRSSKEVDQTPALIAPDLVATKIVD